MSVEENRAALARAVDAVNEGEYDSYFDLYAPGAKLHGYPPPVTDIEQGKQFYRDLWSAFPDFKLTIEDTLAEGDTIAVRFYWTGTNRGELMGAPATGNAVEVSAMAFMRFEDGKVVERWQEWDAVGLMAQLRTLTEVNRAIRSLPLRARSRSTGSRSWAHSSVGRAPARQVRVRAHAGAACEAQQGGSRHFIAGADMRGFGRMRRDLGRNRAFLPNGQGG